MGNYISAELFDAVMGLGLDRTVKFMEWFSHGVELAKSGQPPDNRYAEMQLLYLDVNSRMRMKLPADINSNLVLPLNELDIAHLENGGAPFADLHRLAAGAYESYYGHKPTSLASFLAPRRNFIQSSELRAAGHLVTIGHGRMPRS